MRDGIGMKYFGEGLSGLHKELIQIIRRDAKTGQSKALFLDIHAKLNLSQVSGTQSDEVDCFLGDPRIMKLSRQIHVGELICYRNEVAKQTREIVAGLNFQDLRRKASAADLERILSEGGVTEQEESQWLLDFWGKKDVAGILLMPPLRHVILHLNDCCKWKEAVRTKKRFYRC